MGEELVVRSLIDKGERVDNTERKFGSADVYFPCWVRLRTGETVKALFTRDAINEAIERAASNPEDVANWTEP